MSDCQSSMQELSRHANAHWMLKCYISAFMTCDYPETFDNLDLSYSPSDHVIFTVQLWSLLRGWS